MTTNDYLHELNLRKLIGKLATPEQCELLIRKAESEPKWVPAAKLIEPDETNCIPGYTKDVVPNVAGSYAITGAITGSCAIRIKMSNEQFNSLHDSTKAEMKKAITSIPSVALDFIYDPKGYGELSYWKYEKARTDSVVKVLIGQGAKAKSLLEAESRMKVALANYM